MPELRVTPEVLMEQGNELVKFAGDINDTLSSIQSKIEEIISGWDGLAQDAYYEMYDTMRESLVNFPEMVSGLGQAATAAAEAYAEIENSLKSSYSSNG